MHVGVISFADATNSVPATPGGGALATLQGFVPSTFFAVTVK